ncbi:MAG TPA: AAA family ATPase, partial [Gemmataceae bacterium]|nr:AAA family ATPase [Gemmataceae bacterium]
MRPHTRLVDILRERHDRNGRVPPHTDEYPEEQRGDAWEPPPPSANGTHQSEPKDPQPGVLLSTVKPEQVSWLWPGRIPLGKLTILDGDPGLGKSVLTMDLAASVTRGFAMADGTDGVHGGVIVLNAEDGLADTVVPRLLAAGADLSRILALDAIQERESERAISLPADLDYLEEAIERMSALLVIVDPLMAFLAAQVNSHRDQDCRR